MVAVIMFALLILLVVVGAPVSMAMAIAALCAILFCGLDPVIIPSLISGGISSYTLMAVPFFIFLGNVMNSGGITHRIFDWCEALVGHIKGGLAQVNIISSVIFAGISGTAVADSAGLGMVEIEAMKKKDYDISFSIGVTVASSLLGPIIPPSVVLLVFASLANVSPGKLFMAGVVPGVLMAAVLMVCVYVMCARGKVKCPEPEPFSAKRLWDATKHSIFALLCPVILLVGISTGFATATEVGIIGCVYSIFVSIIYRTFSLKGLLQALRDTLMSSASIMFLMGIGNVLAWIMTKEQVPQAITKALTGMTDSKYIVLLIIMAILLFLGCFMDGTSIQLVMVPILVPIANAFGIDLILLGVVVALAVTIGAATPPVGVCLFVLSSVTGESLETVVRGTKPFYLPILLALLAVAFITPLSTWLPSLLA
ncbi:TRAP transporter large permease [Oscillibacter sp. MSJ-2]|uniref:TRAP transporter large permease n=1 Tax=Dysosmobacter acutus TaxID=2841504 RepID=A0ABS6FBL2_9FIRM|nr:TRAP transporter large permease [Dysosmobacter acutus]MBU5627478.1 TRAP transporter large permease [Dysosmobacter acutus]